MPLNVHSGIVKRTLPVLPGVMLPGLLLISDAIPGSRDGVLLPAGTGCLGDECTETATLHRAG